MGKDFYLFVQSRLGMGLGNSKTTDAVQAANNSKSNGYNVQLTIYPGIAYSLTKKFQLEAGFNNLAYVQFSHAKQTAASNNQSVATNSFSLGSSLSNFARLTIGFRVLLN